MSLLMVDHLSVDYVGSRPVHALRDVSLAIEENEFVGIVGESGCGKSTLGYALTRLEKYPAKIVSGSINMGGVNWASMDKKKIRSRRWREVSIVLQSGMNALNPVVSIGAQFRDVMEEHTSWNRSEMDGRAVECLELVGIDKEVIHRYPHELSGGMKQRVSIALALVLNPKLIVMDEPTTALDMIVQRQIIDNLKELRVKLPFSMIFISHDIGLVLELVDKVVVMYAGEIVEERPAKELLQKCQHPYTRALIRSLPDENLHYQFNGIPGTPPDLRNEPEGCAFASRCSSAVSACRSSIPKLQQMSSSHSVRCDLVNGEI